MDKMNIIGISRHRIQSDGSGIRTLIGFHGCPLRCKYCLNPQCFSKDGKLSVDFDYVSEEIYKDNFIIEFQTVELHSEEVSHCFILKIC